MPTARQKALAEEINSGEHNKKVDSMRAVGYTSLNTGLIRGDGVLATLEEMGFTEYHAKSVVSEIMHNSKQSASDRLRATEQVFKIHGSYAPERLETRSVHVEVSVDNSELEAIRLKYEAELREKLAREYEEPF